MKKYITIFFIILIIGGCSKSNGLENSNFITKDEHLIIVEALKNELELMSLEIKKLSEKEIDSVLINPRILEDELLYVNSSIPFGITLSNDFDLPLEVYKNDNGITIYFKNNEVTQFIESYQLVPNLLVKQQPDSPEYFYSKDIIKRVDENWVIIKVRSIETSLDDETNLEINKLLDSIEFY